MAASSAVSASSPAASLYVGDLHPDVDDGVLAGVFSEFQTFSSARVCQDSATGRSLCYGYVNFMSTQEAQRAIEMKNHTLLNGKEIRVMWSLRDPDARKNGIGNVFVKNLNESIDSARLQELFQKYGNIVSCKVATHEDGKSKGHGFVQFETEESANAAIENLNGSTVDDKEIYVAKFVKKSDRILPSQDANYTNLYMKNLDLDVTEENLREKFSEFGEVASLVIAKDDNGASKGYGFVNFDSPDDARRAMEAMNGSQLGSKVLYVTRALKKADREQILQLQFEEKRKEFFLKYKGSNVYVKNINDDVTDEELREQFSQCGRITSAKLMRDDKGISKGFGFVCFSTPEEASRAVHMFHGYMFHRKPLYVAIAQRKEERLAQLQIQFAQRKAGLVGPFTTVIPGGYPPLYYTTPGVASKLPPRPGLMYQPLALRPGWRANGFVPPTAPGFQTSPLPAVPNASRPHRQNRGRLNGYMVPQSGPHPVSHAPNLQQAAHLVTSLKELSNQRQAMEAKHIPSGLARDMNRSSCVLPAATSSARPISQGSDTLSSMLAADSPAQQKQILGERLYPLVQKRQPDLVAKITGMLLEMDNSELLLLIESPKALAAKVDEAMTILKLSKSKLSGQDTRNPSYLISSEVTVN